MEKQLLKALIAVILVILLVEVLYWSMILIFSKDCTEAVLDSAIMIVSVVELKNIVTRKKLNDIVAVAISIVFLSIIFTLVTFALGYLGIFGVFLGLIFAAISAKIMVSFLKASERKSAFLYIFCGSATIFIIFFITFQLQNFF